MKHAYLILAHKNLNQLKYLIELLDCKSNDIYIHLDAKWHLTSVELDCLSHYAKLSSVVLVKRQCISWGDYSIVDAELELIKAGISSGTDYTYFHLLSGMDMPLKRIELVNKIYEDNIKLMGYPVNYVHFCEGGIQETIKYRMDANNFKYKPSFLISSYFNIMVRIIRKITLPFKLKKYEYGWGSQWFDISTELAKDLVEHQSWIYNNFYKWIIPDEHFLQTFVNEFGYRNKCYSVNHSEMGYGMIMRKIDFSRGADGHPYVFRKDDFMELKNSEMCFARKFDETIDEEIIDMLRAECLNSK